MQKIIILLSDGDANNAATAPANKNACGQSVTVGNQVRAAGISMITIAYGAPTGDKNDPDPTKRSCPTDTTVGRSACSTLQAMATDASMFYSDNVGGTSSCTSAAHSATDLSAIFREIAVSLSGARLLPETTM